MLIGVVSDSHDHVRLLRRALELFRRRKVEAILHAGDFVAPFSARLLADAALTSGVPVHCVYGNNDGERKGLKGILPQLVDGPLRLELGGKAIVLHHYDQWIDPAALAGADIVVSGHTHEIVREKRDGIFYLNPGECCGILSGRATAAVLDTETMDVEILDLAE
ncbi:MAG: metallophosphoesterase [Planctomycetes bacterium]|nr:metallophosphoesterase [Planctomycetota bacterium]